LAIKLNVQKFTEFLEIQRERQLAMQELSQVLGIDISFSDEEIIEYATEQYENYVNNQVEKEVSLLMKSLF
jgi:DNA-binding ferritin-like protein (Dps family)